MVRFNAKRRRAEEEAKSVTLLIRFCDIDAMQLFVRCLTNVSSEAARRRNQFEDHSVDAKCVVDRGEACVDDEVQTICRYATRLLHANESRSDDAISADDSSSGDGGNTLGTSGGDSGNTLGTSGGDTRNTLRASGGDTRNTLRASGGDTRNTLRASGGNSDVARKARELAELSQRVTAILNNPQLLSGFLFSLSPAGITYSLWSDIVCPFFPVIADSSCAAAAFHALCEAEQCIQQRDDEEPVFTTDGDNGEVFGRLVEALRDKYARRRRRGRRNSLPDASLPRVVSYELFEAYLSVLRKELHRSQLLQSKLVAMVDKYKEKLQFGSFTMGTNETVIACCPASVATTRIGGSLYVTDRCVYFHSANDVLIIPLYQPVTCSRVNKVFYCSFSRFVVLPQSSRLTELLHKPNGEGEGEGGSEEWE